MDYLDVLCIFISLSDWEKQDWEKQSTKLSDWGSPCLCVFLSDCLSLYNVCLWLFLLYVSVSQSVCLSSHDSLNFCSFHMTYCLFLSLSLFLSVYYLSALLTVQLFTWLAVCLFDYQLFVCPTVCLCILLTACLAACLSVWCRMTTTVALWSALRWEASEPQSVFGKFVLNIIHSSGNTTPLSFEWSSLEIFILLRFCTLLYWRWK